MLQALPVWVGKISYVLLNHVINTFLQHFVDG